MPSRSFCISSISSSLPKRSRSSSMIIAVLAPVFWTLLLLQDLFSLLHLAYSSLIKFRITFLQHTGEGLHFRDIFSGKVPVIPDDVHGIIYYIGQFNGLGFRTHPCLAFHLLLLPPSPVQVRVIRFHVFVGEFMNQGGNFFSEF